MKQKKIYSKYYLLTKEYVARCGYNDSDNKLLNYSTHSTKVVLPKYYKIHININLVQNIENFLSSLSQNKVSLLRR